MNTWKDAIEMGKSADEYRKMGQYERSIEVFTNVIELFRQFVKNAAESGNRLQIVASNTNLGIIYKMTAQTCIDIFDFKSAVEHLENGLASFQIAGSYADGQTKTGLEKTINDVTNAIQELKTHETRLQEVNRAIFSMPPKARYAARLLGRRLVQLPVENIASNEGFQKEILRALADAYFEGETQRDQETIKQFNIFIEDNAKMIVNVAMELSSVYNFHPAFALN